MKSVRKLCVALLVVIAISSFICGYMLISDPSGRTLNLTIDDLHGSPFKDYAIPGWILAIVIGLGCVIATIITLQRNKHYPVFIMTVGILILLWTLTETFILQQLQFVQVILGLFAVALLLLGNLMRRYLLTEVHHPVSRSVGEAEHHSAHKNHKHKRSGH